MKNDETHEHFCRFGNEQSPSDEKVPIVGAAGRGTRQCRSLDLTRPEKFVTGRVAAEQGKRDLLFVRL